MMSLVPAGRHVPYVTNVLIRQTDDADEEDGTDGVQFQPKRIQRCERHDGYRQHREDNGDGRPDVHEAEDDEGDGEYS